MRVRYFGWFATWLLCTSSTWAETPFAAPSPPPVNVLATTPSAEQLLGMTRTPPPVQILDKPCLFYGSIDYLRWQMKPDRIAVPLLATPTFATDFARNNPDLAGFPMRTLYGDGQTDSPWLNGFRVTLGASSVILGELGFEAGGFLFPLDKQQTRFVSDGGSSALILPYLNTDRNPASPAGLVVAGTINGVSNPGEVTFTSAMELWSAELGPTMLVYDDNGCRLRMLVGFRHVGLREQLILDARNNGPAGYALQDSITATNYFYGGQIGGRFSWDWNALEFEVTGKVAVGGIGTKVRTAGSTLLPAADGKPAESVEGGFYSFAEQGSFRNTYFGVLPEVGINLGWRFGDHVTVRAGYNFLYWNTVAAPGEHVNNRFQGSALPILGGDPDDAPDPSKTARTTDFWAHGFNVGIEVGF